MLSYQHIYHAGNLADVHKHSLLAWMLGYLTRKDKPLSYMETHAGRALYDLSDTPALKTGEAAQGIGRVRGWFDDAHPYAQVLDQITGEHGVDAYPGSPLLAAKLLRKTDAALEKNYPASAKLLLAKREGLGLNSHARKLERGTTPGDCTSLFAADTLIRRHLAAIEAGTTRSTGQLVG